MPHILVFGSNTDTQIKHIRLHAEVIFSEHANLEDAKLELIKQDLEAVIRNYFNNPDSMIYSDKEHAEIMRAI